MHDSLPIRPEALFILYQLQKAGYEGAIVGGAVRDTLGEPGLSEQTDYDFATNATPEETQAIFPESFCENDFGTVSIAQEHLLTQMGCDPTQVIGQSEQPTRAFAVDQATKLHASLSTKKPDETERISLKKPLLFEITTYRSQEKYSNFRQPESLSWGATLSEDLTRRDFTINALALIVDQTFLASLEHKWLATTTDATALFQTVPSSAFTIIDEHAGLHDLAKTVIRTVGDPTGRFTEDALRMLRAIRFSVQLNMHIDPATFEAITQHAELSAHISAERVRDELLKMLASPFPKEAILLLDETGLLKWILPELLSAKGVVQGGHHTTDVWVHSLDALESCPSKDAIVRLATLLHDIGKPSTFALAGGKPTFYNHEIVGARIAKNCAKKLALSRKDIDRIFLLVRHHMFYYQPENTDAAIRRFMKKVGIENLDDILALREGDRLGSGARKTSWRLEEMKQRMQEQLHQPMDLHDLALNGTDLMQELSLQPGPQIGKTLDYLFELVLDDPDLNQKDLLLERAREFIAQ